MLRRLSTRMIWLIGFLATSMVLVACSRFEPAVEQAQPTNPTLAATETDLIPTPTLAGASLPTPTLVPSPTPAAASVATTVYDSPYFGITVSYPADWEPVPGYDPPNDRFAGENGFFMVTAAGGDTIDAVTDGEAYHKLQPYGSQPTIELTQLQGQPARFIWPSADGGMENQAALIVTFPQPVTLSDNTFEHFILYADELHLPALAESLRFSPGVVTDGSAENLWATSGVSPDSLIVTVAKAPDIFSRYGDIATVHVDGSGLNRLTTYNYNADPVLSPDGRRIAYRSVPSSITSLPEPGPRLYEGSYNIWVITVGGEQAWQLTSSEEPRGIPTWSVDSQRVAFVEGAPGTLVEVEVDAQTRRVLAEGVTNARYRPDGNGIAFITADGGLSWLDGSGNTHPIISPASLPQNNLVNDFDWLPDGGQLVYTLADETEREIPELNIGVKYSAWLAAVDGSNQVKLVDDVHSLQVSPSGEVIAARQGSGFGDACMIDTRLLFLHLSPDRQMAELILPTQFSGYPQTGLDQLFFPQTSVQWVGDHLAYAEFAVTCSPDRRLDGGYLIDSFLRRMVQITAVDGSQSKSPADYLATSLSQSPDGQWLAEGWLAYLTAEDGSVQGYDTQLQVSRTDGAQSWTLIDEVQNAGLGYAIPEIIRWSADGRHVFFTHRTVADGCGVFVGGSDLYRANLETGQVQELMPPLARSLGLSQDESAVAYFAWGSAPDLAIRDLTTGAERQLSLGIPFDDAGNIAWSPNSQSLLLALSNGSCSADWTHTIVHVDTVNLVAAPLLEGDDRRFTITGWPEAQRAVLEDTDGRLWWLDVSTGTITPVG